MRSDFAEKRKADEKWRRSPYLSPGCVFEFQGAALLSK